MLQEYKVATWRWCRRHLERVPFLKFNRPKSDPRPDQAGYSHATLPAPTARRRAPRVVLPVWAALAVLLTVAALLLSLTVFGIMRFVQNQQPDPVAEVVVLPPSTPTPPTANPTPTLGPTATPDIRMAESQQLASLWSDGILQWSDQINRVAEQYQFDPNLLAAIMEQESGGDPNGVSYAGAVGLMGIMPQGSGAGLDNRPTAYALTDPATNIEWGAKILSGYLEEVNGDLYWALTVYNGGWLYAHTSTPQAYAANVLDAYARAVLERSGVTVDADQWTIAVKIGEQISAEPLIADDQLDAGWPLYAKHTFFNGETEIVAYAAPVNQ